MKSGTNDFCAERLLLCRSGIAVGFRVKQTPAVVVAQSMVTPGPAVLLEDVDQIGKILRSILFGGPANHAELTDQNRDVVFQLEVAGTLEMLFHFRLVPVAADIGFRLNLLEVGSGNIVRHAARPDLVHT